MKFNYVFAISLKDSLTYFSFISFKYISNNEFMVYVDELIQLFIVS